MSVSLKRRWIVTLAGFFVVAPACSRKRPPELDVAPVAGGPASSFRITGTSLGAFRYRCAGLDGSLGDEREQPTTLRQSRDPKALDRIAIAACKSREGSAQEGHVGETVAQDVAPGPEDCAVRMRPEGESEGRCYAGLLPGGIPAHYSTLAKECETRGKSFVGVSTRDCRRATLVAGEKDAGTPTSGCSVRRSYVCGDVLP